MLGGGARGLQREGSMAGSMKKRRVERSGIAGIGGVVEDDGVLSPSASLPARLMERAVSCCSCVFCVLTSLCAVCVALHAGSWGQICYFQGSGMSSSVEFRTLAACCLWLVPLEGW
jgi:hypothetical protein